MKIGTGIKFQLRHYILEILVIVFFVFYWLHLFLFQELWSEEVKVILNEMWVFFYFFTEMNMINRKE